MAITEEQIARINELYHKSQTREGLTEAEKEEQHRLRGAYIEAVRENLRGQLNNISVKEQDGSVTDLGVKYGGIVREDAHIGEAKAAGEAFEDNVAEAKQDADSRQKGADSNADQNAEKQ